MFSKITVPNIAPFAFGAHHSADCRKYTATGAATKPPIIDDESLMICSVVLPHMIREGLNTTFANHVVCLRIEPCADEPVVGGGVGWSYDWRRRRAPRIFHRRRRHGFMVGGGGVGRVRPDERALKQRTC